MIGCGYPVGRIPIVVESDRLLERIMLRVVEGARRLVGARCQTLYCTRDVFQRVGGFDETRRSAESSELLDCLGRERVRICRLAHGWIATPRRRASRPRPAIGLATVVTGARRAERRSPQRPAATVVPGPTTSIQVSPVASGSGGPSAQV